MPASNGVDDYITEYDDIARTRINFIRTTPHDVMPEAEQLISWGMPTFKLGKINVFHFAAFKRHVSIFPSSYAIEHFADKLNDYSYSKGTIQFQNDEPLPLDLIREIAMWRKQFVTNNPEKK